MTFDYQRSLQRRMRAMHSLYEDACSSMDLDHVNHAERNGVLPIAFSLVHQLLIEDSVLIFTGGPAQLFNDEWASRIGLAIADHGIGVWPNRQCFADDEVEGAIKIDRGGEVRSRDADFVKATGAADHRSMPACHNMNAYSSATSR